MRIFKKIFSIFTEIQSYAFQIESVGKDDNTGLLFFLVKIDGKCLPSFKKDPICLLKEERSSKNFSKQDFNLIISTMLENQKIIIEKKHQKKYILLKHQFSEQLEEPLIVYSDNINKIYIEPAKEVYANLTKIKNFNSEDSACIGHIVGCSETEKEHKYRDNKIHTNVVKFDTSPLSC